MKKILFYTNQFFGQIGGEEMAYATPEVHQGAKGNANTFLPHLEGAEIVATIVCGDNYYVENMDTCKAFVKEQVEAYKPDLVIAGPAFNAGRFGIACADVCGFVKKELGIEAITGLYWENPAVEMYKQKIYIIETAKSAAGVRKAVPAMAKVANKLLAGEELSSPKEDGYFASGKRVNVFRSENGAQRAVSMVLDKVNGREFQTELEISVYEKVEPAKPIENLKKAKIALCTTGGIVPFGNPDHIPAATAKIWNRYFVEGETLLEGKWETVHAGFDPVYANNDPNRVAPYITLKNLEKKGEIGEVEPYLYSTTGNSTSVADATRMGQEMAEKLIEAGVDGVLLTST